jgi:hypothetical protein
MKSRLATCMNLGRRVLVSTLLAVIVTTTAEAQSTPTVSSAEARKAIQVGYAEWAKASVELDMNTIERMLAPDFYFQTPEQKHTRQEFIDSMPSLKITRFDASMLTVEPRGNDWSVLIFEKVEVETKDKDGKTSKGYRVLVARDGWRKVNDNRWILLSSDDLGAGSSYQTMTAQHDLSVAELDLVTARTIHEKARVELDPASGATLARNGVLIHDAITGTVTALSPQLMPSSAKPQDPCSVAPSGVERATPHEVDK